MAKAAKPVAGQPGYDPFEGQNPPAPAAPPASEPKSTNLPTPIEQREGELGPTAIAPKPKREITSDSVRSAKQAKAGELLAHLVETGTNRQKLNDAFRWLVANDEATAEQCFRYLETAEEHGHMPIAARTLQKAGEWLWGAGWTPEAAAKESPSDEMKRLRERAVDQEQQIAMKNAEIVGLKNQLAYLEGELKRLGSENDHLRVGRRASDLGIGRNVLEGAGAAV